MRAVGARPRPPKKFPIDVRDWLARLRAQLPHERRQELIDAIGPAQVVRDLGEMPSLDERRAAYPMAIYVLAARFLREPASAGPDAQSRERLLGQLARLCDRDRGNVLADMRWMLARLAADHRRWARTRAEKGKGR